MGFRLTLLLVFYLITSAEFQVKRKSRPNYSKVMMFYYSEQNEKANEDNDLSKDSAKDVLTPPDDNKRRSLFDELINKNVITEDDMKQLRSICTSNVKDTEELIKDQATIPVGPPGITNIKGEHGAPGLPGLPGAPGAPGMTGLTGEKGDRGFPGLKGESGTKGEKGVPGKDGLDGKQGPAGLAGFDGQPGLDGVPGLEGATGPKGAKGMTGLPGLPGFPGIKGEKGYKGDSPPVNLHNT